VSEKAGHGEDERAKRKTLKAAEKEREKRKKGTACRGALKQGKAQLPKKGGCSQNGGRYEKPTPCMWISKKKKAPGLSGLEKGRRNPKGQ